jgi:hypothetical protein
MIAVLVIAGILGYVFLARATSNVCSRNVPKLCKTKDDRFCYVFFMGMFFPLSIPGILVFKAADFATNPSNYKFRIKFERK